MLGMGLIAQDRRDGLSGEHSIYDNAILANLGELSRHGFIDAVAARRKVIDLFDRLRIKAGDIDVLVGTLSGGNQQKVQVARWLAAGARITAAYRPHARRRRRRAGGDQPHMDGTGARQAARSCWSHRTPKKSSRCCDRAVVLRNGRHAGAIEGGQLSEARLLKLAAGV